IEQNRPWLDTDDVEQARAAPGIGGEPRPDDVLARSIDDQQVLLAGSEGTAEHDEPLGGERVHERRMLVPLGLAVQRKRRIPGGSSHAAHRHVRGHAHPPWFRSWHIQTARLPSSLGPLTCHPFYWTLCPPCRTRRRRHPLTTSTPGSRAGCGRSGPTSA